MAETAIVLQSIDETALATVRAEVEGELADTAGIEIETAEEAQMVAAQASHWARRWDAFETERKAVVAPLNRAKDEVQARYNATMRPLRALIDAYRARVAAYQTEQDRLQRAALLAAREAADKHDALAVRASLANAAPPPKLEGITTIFRWQLAEIDPGSLPFDADNWTPNRLKFEAIARATSEHAEPPPTPGVTYVRIATMRVYR